MKRLYKTEFNFLPSKFKNTMNDIKVFCFENVSIVHYGCAFSIAAFYISVKVLNRKGKIECIGVWRKKKDHGKN